MQEHAFVITWGSQNHSLHRIMGTSSRRKSLLPLDLSRSLSGPQVRRVLGLGRVGCLKIIPQLNTWMAEAVSLAKGSFFFFYVYLCFPEAVPGVPGPTHLTNPCNPSDLVQRSHIQCQEGSIFLQASASSYFFLRLSKPDLGSIMASIENQESIRTSTPRRGELQKLGRKTMRKKARWGSEGMRGGVCNSMSAQPYLLPSTGFCDILIT